MNILLLLAGVVAILLAVAHSFLGEKLIFQRLGRPEQVSLHGLPQLSRRHWEALRTTWHLASLLGLGFAGVIFWLALPDVTRSHRDVLVFVTCLTFLISGIFWIIGTRGKHPGWVAMLLIAFLVWWS